MSLGNYVYYSQPIIQYIADWEARNGTMYAMLPNEYANFCEGLMRTSMHASARAAMSAIGDKDADLSFFNDGVVTGNS